jgi:spermidine/putrescine-binding protein
VQKFHSSEYINALANGDICVAVGWSGDVLQAKKRAVEAKQRQRDRGVRDPEGRRADVVRPDLAIPADAKNRRRTRCLHQLPVMQPEVIAKASNYIQYANGNLALAAVARTRKSWTTRPIYPPADAVVEKLFTITPYPPAEQRVLNRAVDPASRAAADLTKQGKRAAAPPFAFSSLRPTRGWGDGNRRSGRSDLLQPVERRFPMRPSRCRRVIRENVTKRFGDFVAVENG